ncbi:MAG: hypothetical protein E7631_04910 [Ruminococcaceae bacterium]|nr:hypothetical protein [Oscillospiraceae bacterium]
MSCVIFGAGKIARGFVGHILTLSGIPFVFVEKYKPLVDAINTRGSYTVNVMGNAAETCVITGVHALSFEDREEIVSAIAAADVVFTAVGGKNLEEIVPFLAEGIARKASAGGNLNVITCENWKKPAQILHDGVAGVMPSSDYLADHVGFAEAVIMRSGIEPDEEQLAKDPLWVNVSNFWQMPVDGDSLKGKLPEIRCVSPMRNFAGFLERKFYTYNAANGTVSFIGALLGYKDLGSAAYDERIIDVLEGVYDETSRALAKKHGIPLEEQIAFAGTSRAKLQDKAIIDTIERNARDPLRKLGKDDRLVGSANLVLDCGILPEHLCISIAAALYYVSPGDPSAEELVRMRQEEGIDAVLTKVCSLEPEGTIGKLVKEKITLLKEWGWIHE